MIDTASPAVWGPRRIRAAYRWKHREEREMDGIMIVLTIGFVIAVLWLGREFFNDL